MKATPENLCKNVMSYDKQRWRIPAQFLTWIPFLIDARRMTWDSLIIGASRQKRWPTRKACTMLHSHVCPAADHLTLRAFVCPAKCLDIGGSWWRDGAKIGGPSGRCILENVIIIFAYVEALILCHIVNIR